MSARSVLILAALLAALLPVSAEAGETKTLDAIGVTWKVPDGFAFQDPTPEQQRANYHAVAVDAAIPAQLYLVSETLRDRVLSDIQGDVITVMRRGLFKQTTAIRTDKATLSGIAGFVVYGEGKIEGGHDAYAAAWGTAREGRFYVVLMVTYYGKHASNWKALDAARLGFRLKGADGEDAPATGAWPDLSKDAGSGFGDGGSDDEPGQGKPDGPTWPEQGPTWDEATRTITFPTHNLTWALPEGTPFRVGRVTDDESQPSAQLVLLTAAIGDAAADVVLQVQPRASAQSADEIVSDTSFMTWAAQALHERMPGGARSDMNAKVMGKDAAFLLLRGKNKDGAYRAAGFWVFTHGEELYVIRVLIGGENGVEREVVPAVETLLCGLALIDPAEPVPGPLAGSVPAQYGDRGKYQGSPAVLRGPNIELEKPAFMARLDPTDAEFAFAAEGRTEDRSAYIYIDVRSYEMSDLSKSKISFESMASQRVASWKDAAGDSASTGGGSEPWKKERWAKAKGIGWRFEGKLDGHPYIELGYIVKQKARAYQIRVQLGGTDAESKFADTLKDLEKNWDWVK